ncbi:LysR family transcriptional regulator [Achromobacter pestifer]|uniref:HTH-type transcriptional regulator GltC n=1 Tax=Achromobacter pestifer TaxID=1353889 RepID=A0A6S6Z9N4_9BURK|nr:LysR family transcriptional regulator [Achromobacter pestifer]CAB3635043.1 HTH-type transcriptional regulator GltC [Achromobacter pestifer]
MELRQLRTVLAIAETGSLTKAAELLHVVQPALSRQLKQLEDELGTPLFERNRLGMVLTVPGRRFVDQVRVSLKGLNEARAGIGAAKSDLLGTVSIGMLPGLAAALAGPLVIALQQQYPNLRVRIATGFSDFLQEGLEGGKLDICLMGDYLQSELLQTSPVYSEPIYVLGLPGSGLSEDAPMTLEAVSRMPMVVPEARSLRNVIDRACTILGVNLNLVAESDSTAVILELVLRGVGYTILPVIPIMTMLAEKRIEGAPIISPTLQRTVIVGTAVLNRNPRIVNALHAELIRVLEPYIKQFDHVGVRWLAD